MRRAYKSNRGSEAASGSGCGGQRPFDELTNTVSLASLTAPATTIAVCEARRTNNSQPQVNDLGSIKDNQAETFTGHLGMTNFLFVDGHVKSLKVTATVSPTVNMWTNDNQTGNSSTHVPTMMSAMATAQAFLDK